jgi:hypothetical protein
MKLHKNIYFLKNGLEDKKVAGNKICILVESTYVKTFFYILYI